MNVKKILSAASVLLVLTLAIPLTAAAYDTGLHRSYWSDGTAIVAYDFSISAAQVSELRDEGRLEGSVIDMSHVSVSAPQPVDAISCTESRQCIERVDLGDLRTSQTLGTHSVTMYRFENVTDADYITIHVTVTEPSPTPSPSPSPSPTAKPSAPPSAIPSATPTAKPSAKPTAKPSATPTAKPSAKPTAKPSATPTAKPSATPTAKPSATPTAKPSAKRTDRPAAPIAGRNGRGGKPETGREQGSGKDRGFTPLAIGLFTSAGAAAILFMAVLAKDIGAIRWYNAKKRGMRK